MDPKKCYNHSTAFRSNLDKLESLDSNMRRDLFFAYCLLTSIIIVCLMASLTPLKYLKTLIAGKTYGIETSQGNMIWEHLLANNPLKWRHLWKLSLLLHNNDRDPVSRERWPIEKPKWVTSTNPSSHSEAYGAMLLHKIKQRCWEKLPPASLKAWLNIIKEHTRYCMLQMWSGTVLLIYRYCLLYFRLFLCCENRLSLTLLR